MNFFHRLFNPHCPDCIEENQCKSCIVLREENLFLKGQIQELQNHILNPKITIEPTIETDDLKPLHNYRKPFSILKLELEAADRLKAKERDEQILKNQAAKPDIQSPITNDEGKVDPELVEQELINITQEIAQNG